MKLDKNIPDEHLHFAKQIWDFLSAKDKLEKADLIFVLCSHDLRVAEYAASLYQKNFASHILFSGGLNFFTKHVFPNSEAESFADCAMERGVPKESIFLEPQSTNTGENIQYSQKLLSDLGFQCDSIIAVQKPSMTLRIQLALQKQWPGPNFLITSPNYSLLESPHSKINLFMIINEIVGDLGRVIAYPKLGFQEETFIPEEISAAYQFLISKGYNLHLVPNR
ncbi:YdcF family protein [Leptospira biflexa]|uniref:YdcF family protein n=1 Tax=Leptospira biflexa TaxID=172 RepID=UPI001084048B|nr:YdcF family protein [Leptospira biflexa]TGM32122.1 YdcF family protein [Leptospira biflexa]TGM42100.1 YdcF family protein [Leptospira biflexa]TGM51891.1 YdcF family protein [Leptospira biflexa]